MPSQNFRTLAAFARALAVVLACGGAGMCCFLQHLSSFATVGVGSRAGVESGIHTLTWSS